MSYVHIPGKCVQLPKGQKSHNQRHCDPGQTWRRAYKKRVNDTAYTVKRIGKSMRSNLRDMAANSVHSSMLRRCDSSDIAVALNSCLKSLIEPVQALIKKQEDRGVLDPKSSPETLQFIKNQTVKGTTCVLSALSGCSKNRDEIAILVDQYMQNQLSTPSSIPDIQRTIITNKEAELQTLRNFIESQRAASSV